MPEEKSATAKPIVDQHTIIMRNIARWHEEQARKEANRIRFAAQAASRGLTPKQFLELKRGKILLKDGRATIEEIVKAHGIKVIR